MRYLLCALLVLFPYLAQAQAAPTPVSVPPITAEESAELETLLKTEVDRLQGAIPTMHLVLLNTDDTAYRGFISAGVLKVSDSAFDRMEQGLAGLEISQGKINGNEGAVCYILYSPHLAGFLVRSFVNPIREVASAQSAAAYLMAHETGHCLDQLEREQTIPDQAIWASAELAPLGLAPAAVQRVFGDSMPSAAYLNQRRALAADNAQAQYEERVADAFGILWVWRLGGSAKVRDVVQARRAYLSPWSAHATAPILAALDNYKDALAKSQSVADVWALARQAQLAIGVDPSLGKDSTHVHNPLMDAPATPEERAAAETALPQPPAPPTSHNFNDLPRFGSGGLQQN